MALGESVLCKAMVSQGGDIDLGYDRNKFARNFNEETMKLHKCSSPKPRVVRRMVTKLPIWLGI